MNLLNTKEVATRLNMNPLTVIRLVDAGELVAIDVNPGAARRTLRFRPEDVEQFIASREKKAEISEAVK